MRKIPPHISKKHPIVTQKYAIFTAAVDAFVEKLGDWIDGSITGAYVYGPSRFGKTRAVKYYLGQLLEERFGAPVPIFTWIRSLSFKTPSEFYKSMLSGFSHAYVGPKVPAHERLIAIRELMIARADNCETNYVVLIIDEAQGLTTQEWLWILAIQNELDSDGYILSVFSIASHQMTYEFDLMSRTGNPHIAARFLIDNWRFPGIESIDELEFILDGYDEQSKWPDDNGVSYLAHFAPHHYHNNKRLASCAPMLWECMVALLPINYKLEWSFPMKHVALSIEEILFDLAAGTDWDDATSSEAWIMALTKHRFSDHMRAISIDL